MFSPEMFKGILFVINYLIKFLYSINNVLLYFIHVSDMYMYVHVHMYMPCTSVWIHILYASTHLYDMFAYIILCTICLHVL